MSKNSIPKSFIVFIVIAAVFIVYLCTILMPSISKIPQYQSEHDSAVATIANYEDVLKNQDSEEKKVNKLTEQYNKKQETLFVDSKTSIEDLQSIFKSLGINMLSLTRGDGVADTKGRTSTGGIPLYSTSLSFSYNGTVNTTKSLIHYLEKESKGCYFINSVNMSPLKSGSSNFVCSFSVTLYYFDATQTATSATEPTTTAN